jgi:integrase
VKRRRLNDNPVKYLEPFREKPRDRYVTDAEFNAVYQHASPIVRAAMLLAAVTGLRQGDLLGTRRSDFGPDGLTIKTSKTGAGLVIGWSDGLRMAVVGAVGTREFIPLMLLATEEGRKYTGRGFRTLWYRARERAKEADPQLENFTFNDLRVKAGSDGRDWQLLGHMDRKTFERVYNRLPRKVAAAR